MIDSFSYKNKIKQIRKGKDDYIKQELIDPWDLYMKL